VSKEKEEKTNKSMEKVIKNVTLKYDPVDNTFTVKIPVVSPTTVDEESKAAVKVKKTEEETEVEIKLDEELLGKSTTKRPATVRKLTEEDLSPYLPEGEVDTSLEAYEPGIDPIRVKIHLKAYLKMALHALKYAHPNIPQKKWVEIIGLMTGYIENNNTPLACLVVTDAYPIGHGTDVNAQIQNPQSHVKVYKELKGEMILGWYHSHPSYGAFMSKTDYDTQVRYQRLGARGSQLTAPIALVIDPTKITHRSYGFKIFRLKESYKEWEEPRYEVLNCPLESLPDMLKTMLPLSEGRAMFLEYDHE